MYLNHRLLSITLDICSAEINGFCLNLQKCASSSMIKLHNVFFTYTKMRLGITNVPIV